MRKGKVAYATCSPRREGWEDDLLSARVLEAAGITVELTAWDDPDAEWAAFDLVVVRSPWDYAERLEEFLTWTRRVGAERLRNHPDLIEWNTDKRYLAELDGAGLPVPPTMLIAPGGYVPEFTDEVVIKPLVGAGGRDTGRFTPGARDRAVQLLERLGDNGEIAMIQPYMSGIEEHGETSIVLFGGLPAFALSKKAFLPADRVAPQDDTGIAEAMHEAGLVGLAEAAPEELELAIRTVSWLTSRFGRTPLYARIDMVRSESGAPVLVEAELTEPSLYLGLAEGLEPSGADAFATAVMAELG